MSILELDNLILYNDTSQWSPPSPACSSNDDGSLVSLPESSSAYHSPIQLPVPAFDQSPVSTTKHGEDNCSYFSDYLVSDSSIDDGTPMTQSPLQIAVLGVPVKSRVETQIRLCLQLLTSNGTKVETWPYLKLPDHLMTSSRLKQRQEKQSQEASRGTTSKAEDAKMLFLNAHITCFGRPDKPVRMCKGCILRERKRAERSKNGPKARSDLNILDGIDEQDRILLFNCGPNISFSSGDAILPTRITCYCRHHGEKTGFQIHFLLKNSKDELVAAGSSPPIMITDDHKSTRTKGQKRSWDGPDSNRVPVTPGQDWLGSTAGDIGVHSDIMSWMTDDCMRLPDSLPKTGPITQVDMNLLSSLCILTLPTPRVTRLVPTQGPTCGGTEVVLLGSGFTSGLTCLFGEQAATTVYWSDTTLVCKIPPAPHAGPVLVSFRGHAVVLDTQPTPLFTYYDASDRALFELALQVVGLNTTGKVQDARRIALQIVQGNHSERE